MELSSYRAMWVLTMFDLPVKTREAKRRYAKFRKLLLEDGFSRMQYSVYGRHCPSEENAAVHIGRVERGLPPEGKVRILTVTDRQFEKMRCFWGNRQTRPEKAPKQLTLF